MKMRMERERVASIKYRVSDPGSSGFFNAGAACYDYVEVRKVIYLLKYYLISGSGGWTGEVIVI